MSTLLACHLIVFSHNILYSSQSVDSDMSAHDHDRAPTGTVRSQPAPRYEYDPITGQLFRVDKAPSDHMLLSILSLLFCMLFPTTFCAILSVIYSFQVST